MADRKLISFFPLTSMKFLKEVCEQIIERRRGKLEVGDLMFKLLFRHDLVNLNLFLSDSGRLHSKYGRA